MRRQRFFHGTAIGNRLLQERADLAQYIVTVGHALLALSLLAEGDYFRPLASFTQLGEAAMTDTSRI